MKLVAIGTSAGGVHALHVFLRALPKNFSCPIACVQHIPERSEVNLAVIFGDLCHFKVLEAEDKMAARPNHIYFAPSGYHLLVERDGTFALNLDEPVNFSRPSIDVLFDSVAQAYGPEAVGILMTGASQDGACGLQAMSVAGARTIVEDPETAEVPIMPRSALKLFQPSAVVPLEEIAAQLVNPSEVPS